MLQAVPARVFLVAVTIGALAAIPLSGPASAASTPPSCTKLVSPAPITVNGALTSKATLTGCTPLSATGGTGKSVSNITKLVSTTTWAGGDGTTIVKVTYKPIKSLGKCPTGTTHILSTGIVTGGSGAAFKVIKKGAHVTASVCITTKGSAGLEPGTKYVF